MNESVEARLRHLAGPGHLLAWLLLLVPLTATGLTLAMPGPEGVGKRIQGVALLIDKLPLPALGLLLGLLLAGGFRQRMAAHVYAAVSLALGIAVLLLAPLFLLDSVQLRSAVELQRLYDVNIVRALIEHLCYGTFFLLLAFAAWRTLRDTRPLARDGAPDLVRTPPTPGR